MKALSSHNQDSTLLADFARYFDLSLALTEEQRIQVYRVRYRVYCEEFGYEPAATFMNSQEVDEFDGRSMHCLVTHRKTGTPAGCVRLVMVEGDQLMPMEKHCGSSIDKTFMRSMAGQRGTFGEISRLAVDGAFRRRQGEGRTRFGTSEAVVFSEGEQRTFPLLALSLFLASAAVADVMGKRNCFAIMEPFLHVILRRNGVPFHRIGEDFEFRGKRAPYHAGLDQLVGDAPEALRQSFYALRDQFAETLHPLSNSVAPRGRPSRQQAACAFHSLLPLGA